MVVIADSDCIRKLAYCSFLSEFLQIVEVPPNDIWVLPDVAFQLRRKLSSSSDALADFEKFFKKTKQIPKASLNMLARFESLDSGEQQIFALLCEVERVNLVATGDKAAMRLVASLIHKDPSLGKLMETSTIWCFESVILRLIEKQGFSITNARIKRWKERDSASMDMSMRLIFTDESTADSVKAELKARIHTLRASCIGVPIQ
ncbi:hypothetical protein B9Z44_07085 [Limnohabitans curvus]|uniref:PIN domain-containing protein n=1 Tax=Limnohabitans curvus TaxID=323423 RepID=A0A315ETU6_9BURK|nr:hypothetical protein [Limnohabitans curvus]PUE59352.1 hypothetical protein B9Z44_07085 [Limnohabitans curvus]